MFPKPPLELVPCHFGFVAVKERTLSGRPGGDLGNKLALPFVGKIGVHAAGRRRTFFHASKLSRAPSI